MKIVMLTPFPPMRDGIGDYAASLISPLESHHEIYVLTPGTRGEGSRQTAQSLHSQGNYVEHGWNKDDPLYPLHLAKMVATIGPDVIHIQHVHLLFGRPTGLPLLASLIFFRLRQQPVVTTLHSIASRRGVNSSKGYFRQWMVRTAFALSTRLTCALSSTIHVMKRSDAELLVDEFRVPRRKIAVIPYYPKFITKVSDEESKIQLGLHGRFVLGCFGFADPGKGLADAIRALAAVTKKMRNAHLVFVGGFDKRQDPTYRRICEIETLKLQAHVSRSGLERAVHFFIGVPAEDLPRLLSAVDVFLFPYYGGAGISAALYAISRLEKPVVVTDIPKFSEVVHRHNGLKVPVGSPQALADAALLLHDRSGLSKTLGKGLAATLGRQTQRAIANQMIALYEQVRRAY